MDDEPPIFVALERISLLCRSCSFDPRIDGYAELLGNVQDTLRRVENFLQRCSETCADHGSAIVEPHVPAVSTINGTTAAQSSNCSSDFQIPFPNGQNLPALVPNTEFDHLPVGSSCVSASTITPTSAFFDYARYAADRQMQGEGMGKQQEGGQDECHRGHEDQAPDQVTREDVTAAEALAGGNDIAQEDRCAETRNECDKHNAIFDNPESVSRNISGPPNSPDADAAVQPPCTVDQRIHNEHVFNFSQKEQNQGKSQRRIRIANNCSPCAADRQIQPTQESLRVPVRSPCPSRKRKRKRKQREKSQHSSAMDSNTWLDLDPIIGKVACPDQILQHLTNRAGDCASDTSRMRYLTVLFFHFGGPHAFRQIRDAFSALCGTREMNGATTGGRIRALAQFDHAHPFEQRAIQLGLCLDRAHQMQIAHDQGDSYPDRAALRKMMVCAYPALEIESEEYEEKKGQLQSALSDGHNWLVAHQRCPSALWMFPRNVSENIFRRLPSKLVCTFFDILYEHRGHFFRRVDGLLGSHVADFVAGKLPVQPIPFDKMATTQMGEHSMDSDYFIGLCKLVAGSVCKDG